MRFIASAGMAFALLTVLVSCRQAPRSVAIGVDNSPPFYVFGPDGAVQGLAVEVLDAAARRRNIQIRWVPMRDTPLDDALASRRVQMWPLVGSTPERKAKFFLSEAWLESDYVLVSPKEKPVRSVAEATGLKIAHARLRMTTILAKRYLAGSQFVVLPDRAQAVQEMCFGRAAAVLVESRMVEAILLERPQGCNLALNITTVPGATTLLSIAAVPEAAALARELRSEISKMALSGEFGAILDKWAPFSAEIARSIGAERAEAERNRYLTQLAGGLLACTILLGFVARRAYKHRRAALAAEETMRCQAAEDALTGLANRTLFTERLRRRMAKAHPDSGCIFGVLFLDLDHFKVINDSLGHLAGDQLLLGIASRLTQTVRSSDLVGRFSDSFTVARLGGDEFAVLIENIQSEENARSIADRIQRDMSLPFMVESRSVFTTFSIGVALSNGTYRSAEEILRDADIAMYAAKATGKACFAVFDPAMRARAIARLEIETDLRRALSSRALTSRELIIHYQPEIDLRSGEVVAFEALVRWQHPKNGLVPPLDFIPIAEETGLIAPLGAWVLEEACSQMRSWQTAFPEFSNLRISVNLSGKQLTSKDLLRDVAQALEVSLLPPECLDLEVTESILMEDAETAIQTLLKLKRLGLGLQIDDFGTGYSSLSYLHRLPFDTLKIDRSFVHSMDAQEDGIEIVRTIMALAQSLKMTVVAEGVENRVQLSHLREMGCEFAQGNHFSEPLDAASAERLLAAQSLTGNDLSEFVLAS
jgi:diguanylate cyclase (GGDEF)-like protein